MPAFVLRSQDAVSYDSKVFAWYLGLDARRSRKLHVAEAHFPDLDAEVSHEPGTLTFAGATLTLPDRHGYRDPRHLAAWLSDNNVPAEYNPASRRMHFSGTGTLDADDAGRIALGLTQALTCPGTAPRRPRTGEAFDTLLLHANLTSDAMVSTASGVVSQSSVLGVVHAESGKFRNEHGAMASVVDHGLAVIYLWLTDVSGSEATVHSEFSVIILSD